MSRHSHWAKIKHDKAAADKKRGALFSKLLRAVQIAAREGDDLLANFKLRLALDQAKSAGVPKDTVERAVKRGSGKDKEGVEMFEEVYEGFAPGGAAVIIEAVTDNKNRTLQDLRHLFSKFGGNLAGAGSVAWQFDRKGVIRLPAFEAIRQANNLMREDLEMRLIEIGAEDLVEEDEGVSVMIKPEELKTVEERISALKIIPEYVGLEWRPKEKIELTEEKRGEFEAFQDALDEMEDVSNYYTNAICD